MHEKLIYHAYKYNIPFTTNQCIINYPLVFYLSSRKFLIAVINLKYIFNG